MHLLVYSCVVILAVLVSSMEKTMTCFQMSFNGKGYFSDINHRNAGKKRWLVILMITFILSVYSGSLGLSPGLVDRRAYMIGLNIRYPGYLGSFEALLNAPVEPGFLLLNWILGRIVNEPFTYFFIISFITTFITMYFLSVISTNFFYSTLLVLISQYFFYSTYLIKQFLAVSIANIAFLFFLKNKRYLFLLFTFIACTFHFSALFVFLLFFNLFSNRRITSLLLVGLFVITLVLLPVLYPAMIKLTFLSRVLEAKEIDEYYGGTMNSILKGVPFYIVTFLALMKRRALAKQSPKAYIFIAFAVIISISWVFTGFVYYAFRISLYLMLPTIAVIPFLLKEFSDFSGRILLSFILLSSFAIITARQLFIVFY